MVFVQFPLFSLNVLILRMKTNDTDIIIIPNITPKSDVSRVEFPCLCSASRSLALVSRVLCNFVKWAYVRMSFVCRLPGVALLLRGAQQWGWSGTILGSLSGLTKGTSEDILDKGEK